MAYRVGLDEEEKKRQSVKTSQTANLVRENQAFRQKYTQGGALSKGTTKVEIDLAQYKPTDIAELGYRMPAEQRAQFVDFAQGYYKKAGAQNIPKAEDISAQWNAWDAERDNTIRQNTIREKESTLGAGKSLNRIGTLSAIASMADGGEKDAAVSAYAELAGTIGSKYYNPYMSATSEPLKALGVESVDDAWFAQNADYVGDLLKDPVTGKPTKPGNSATDAQKRAYSIYTLAGNEEQTKQAETELAALYEEIGAAAQYKGFDAVAYIEGIDWDEYPMLQKMREGEKTGAYPQLNRAVPMSVEGLYGAVYCAQKGIEVGDAREYEMYAGAWVNELKKQAKAGTNEEEPEGWLEKIGDFITGEAGDREERIAQGEAAKATLEKLGVEMMEAPEEEAEPKKYEQAQRTEELPEWVKKPTMESRVKSFQHGVYGFIENAQDRNALREIDAQIKTLEEQREVVRGEKNATLYGSQMATGYKGDTAERLTAIDEKISRLNAKKTRIAFAGSGETATKTNIMQKRQFAPGRTAGLEITPESAIDVLENYAQADAVAQAEAEAKNQNMQPPIGHGTTEWNMWYSASTDEMDAVYDAYDAAMARANEMDADARLDVKLEAEDALAEGTYRAQIREKVLRGLIPDDEETAAARAGADVQRISMLCEREVASALGDEETVAAINNQMIEAGYPTCWPEEEAIIAQERADSIEYAKGWGDDEVRKRLGIKDGRELTDDDYYEAAHTDKGFWDWSMWGVFSRENKENAQRNMRAVGEALTSEVVPLDAQTTETALQGYVDAAIGENAGIEQAEAFKDVAAAPLAIAGGIMNAGANVVQGVTDTAEAFAFEAAKAQYGSKLTREQMELLSPGYKMVSDAKKATDTAVQTVAPDVSQRSGWVQTLGGLTETVVQNASLAKAGSVVGKINANFAKMLGIKDVAALQKVYQTSSNITRNMGFTLSGMKSGLSEAYAMGLDGAEAISYAITSAGISMAVENMSLDPLTKSSQVMNAMPDGAQAATKGWREFVKKTGRSALGEAMEEAVESPLQNIKTKILADPDMAWFGEGGVIDPGEMASGAALGFAAGAILGGVSEVGGRKLQKESTQTQESTSEEKTVENEAEAVQDKVVDAESATTTTTGKVKKTPEQIARKAQDYAEIMEAAQDPDAGEDVIAFAQMAAEEVAQKGEMTDETRAQLRGMLGLKRLKTKMIMEDMANMARIIGSEATSAQTKAMAEEALSGMGNDGLDASTRKAVTQAAARDIAKAQAQTKTIEARKELEKATTDEADIRKEYGQMNGRMVALNDNMSELIAQVIDGKANKEIQGQYQTLLSKTNSLQKRLENQKARMRDAQERKEKAQAAYDAAKAQAKADEEVIYEQIVNAGAKTEPEKNTETQTQPEAVQAQTDPEAELDKATIEALEDGDEEKALGIQKAKEGVKIQVSNPSQYSAMPSNGEAITAQRAPEREPRQAVREVFDRFEDYDVRGFKKYMKDTPIYVNEQQRAEIKNITGLSHNKAGYKYGVRFTNDRSKGSPLDGGTWSDISGYFPGILDEGSSHPVNDLIGVIEDIRKNEQEKRAGGILRYMSLRVRSRTSGDGAGSVPTESGQQIIEKLRKTFPGVTVRARSPIGAIDDRGGYAQVQTGGGRVVGLQNVEDYVHEIGHLLSVKQNGVNEVERSEKGRVEQVRVKQEHVAGVDAMVQKLMQTDPEMLRAYSDAEERRQEAISIFWERWLLGDEAASEFAGDALYEVLTGTADAKQMKALEEARKSYIVLHGATQAQRDEAQIVSERVARERALDAATTQSFVSRSITDVFDENYAAKLIDRVSLESALAGMSDEEIKEKRKQAKKTGSLMMEETDRLYYQQANLSKASGVAKHWVKNKIIGRRGQVLLDTNISETVAPISKEEKTAFGRYVMLLNELDARNLQEKHRQEAAESDTQYVPRANEYYNLAWAEMSKAEIEREIATVEAEHTQFKSVHEGLRKIWTTLMEEYQIAPGYIENAQEAWDAVNAARPHYLPTRVTENSTVREERQTQSIAKEGREIRSASAGERDVVDPVMTMVSELTRMAHQSAAMDVKNTIARVYDEYEGQGRFFREITQAQVDAQRRIFDAIAQRDSFNLTDVDAETAQQIIDEGTDRAERRVIVSIEDGKARYFEVLDQMAYDMLARTETPEEASREMRALAAAWRAVDNTFRATTTLLSPFFGIKNSVRDASTAAVFGTQRNAVELVTNFAKSIVESGKYFFRGELESDALRQFAAMGGLEGDSYSHDVEGERQKLKDVFKEEDGRLRKMMDGVVEALRNFNDTIETGMRFAQFQMGLKAGQSTQRAFRMSQEVTTDFSRTGRKAKKMAKYFFFFNASLQGTYDVINAMQESEFDPQRTARMIQRSIVHAAVMPLALAIARAMMWDDEEKEKYDALAENVKRENHVLGFIGKKAIIIPKGQSLIFTLGDAIGRTWADGITTELRKGNSVGDYFRHEGLKDVGTLAWDLAADVWPFQTSVFQTGIDLMINRNHWGDEITPEYMKLWDARNKYDNYTSSVAVAIGQVTGAFGISPKMIHYAIDQQMGFVGDLILKMTTPSSAYGQSLEESEGIGDFMLQNFVMSPARLLFDMSIKGFTSDIRLVSSVRDDFEAYKDFFEATLSEYDQYNGERDKMRSKISGSLTQKEYTNAYNDAVQMNKYLNKAKQAINNLYKEMKANPDETQACQDAIMQIQMVSNQAAESWQRRYMDGDMSVQVIIPKVKEGNGK